jgi:hypothetical protein
MDGLYIDSKSINVPSTAVGIFDTGSSLGIFPESMALAVSQALGLKSLGGGGLYGIPCPSGKIPTNMPLLRMKFGGIELKFSSNEYLFPYSDGRNTFCVSGIVGMFADAGPLQTSRLIIGNVFLRRYYTVFDQKNRKIGFATCNRTPNIESKFVVADSSNSPNGTSNPFNVNNETTSRSSWADSLLSLSSTSFTFALLFLSWLL